MVHAPAPAARPLGTGKSKGPSFKADLDEAWMYGMYAACGCVVQGVANMELKPSGQSVLHWGAAGVFCWASFKHTMAVRDLYVARQRHTHAGQCCVC